MCGRFTLDPSVDEIRDILSQVPEVRPGDIAPTNLAPVLTLEENTLRTRAMAWGFPKWDGKGVVFNARAETALEKPMFRKSLLQNRVLIPATGFYEWKAIPGQKRKEQYRFCEPGESMLFMAGFYGQFKENDGEIRPHFTMLTTAANDSMLSYHDRMPVLISRSQQHDWLAGEHLEDFLSIIPPALHAEPAR